SSDLGDRPGGRGKKRPARRGRQDRNPRIVAAAGRIADAVASARHAFARASQPARRQPDRAGARRARQRRDQHCPIRRQQQPLVLMRSRPMTKVTLIRTAALAALVVLALVGRLTPVTAADPGSRIVAPTVQIIGDKATQFMPLGVGKSVVVDLPADIKDVLVADPKIANAVVRTARRAYI